MTDVQIDWVRWFGFLLVGIPLLVWLLGTRNNVARLLAVFAILVFVQDFLVSRRTIVALGVGPSLILCYSAVVALYLHQGRFPKLGTAGPLWAFFLATALIGVVVGSVGTGLVFFNIYAFQEYYLEGLLFFVLGLMALRDDEEISNFFCWFSLSIGLGVALLHLFELVSGWRPGNIQAAVAQGLYGEGRLLNPGAVFANPNTLGTFYAMTIPVVLMQMLPGGARGWRRAALGVAFVLMTMSLALTTARGGALFSALICAYALVLGGVSLGRVIGGGATLVVLLGAAWIAAGVVLPETRERISGQLEEEGLRTGRFDTWRTFGAIAIENPLGLGLDVAIIQSKARLKGSNLGSAHNTFIDRAVRTGFLGLFAFLALVGHILLRNLRAVKRSRADPARRRALIYLLLPLLGFLAGGIVEPIYDNGSKLNQMFWCFSGLSYVAAARALVGAAASEAAPGARRWRPVPQPGFVRAER